MIGRLSGKLVSEELDGTAIVDVGGVGYELMLPLGAAVRARDGSDQVTLHVHTHVREEALDLYGFPSSLERSLFRLLISVPNIGPKTALAVLSELPPPDLIRAVNQNDLTRLNKITGIGKKTAERLVLELKGKLPNVGLEPLAVRPPKGGGDRDRILGALTNMGYRPAEAERAVASLEDQVGQVPVETALKAALVFLAR